MHINPSLDMKYDEPADDPRYAEPPPRVVGRFPSSPTERESKIQNLKYLIIAYTLIIFLFGGTILGIGIWMAVDRSFLTYIIGNDLYSVSIYMVLIGGGIVFFVAFLGCFGAITEHRCMMATFFCVMIFLVIVLVIGGIIGIVFRSKIGDSVQATMEETLINQYGVDFQHWINRRITEAWDRTQERDQKPYVPQSCCVRDRFYRYVNREVCQKWRLGPPGSPDDGAINRALYYEVFAFYTVKMNTNFENIKKKGYIFEGCYDASVRYLNENSGVIIGLGLSIAFLLVLGIVMTFFLLKWTRSPDNKTCFCF